MKETEPFLITTPRYEIRSPGWEHLEVFDDQKDAYQTALSFALKYPNTDFVVIKKVNWEEVVIFKINCNLSCGLDNIQDFYKSMISMFQSKLDETMMWRRSDGS